MVKVLLTVAAFMLLTGCASVAPLSSLLGAPTGPPPLQVHEQTSVELDEGNFSLVKTNVLGKSNGFSLLGFITIYPATLTKALGRLYSHAQMREGQPQTISHLVIEQTSSYWILFGIPQVIVRADIVQFNHEAEARAGGDKPKRPKPPDESDQE